MKTIFRIILVNELHELKYTCGSYNLQTFDTNVLKTLNIYFKTSY